MNQSMEIKPLGNYKKKNFSWKENSKMIGFIFCVEQTNLPDWITTL